MEKAFDEKIKKTRREVIASQKHQKQVIGRYGKSFHPDNIGKLSKEEFLSFLVYKNNKHWKSINRWGTRVAKDMVQLRKALYMLLNEEQGIKNRLDALVFEGRSNYVKGLSRAVLTPILMMVSPTKYGVYNKRSEAGLKKIGVHPNFGKNVSFGEKYAIINKILLGLGKKYNVSLWELDTILGKIGFE